MRQVSDSVTTVLGAWFPKIAYPTRWRFFLHPFFSPYTVNRHLAENVDTRCIAEGIRVGKEQFRKRLKDEKSFKGSLETTSMEQVWEAAEEVQATQGAERRIRHTAKIKGFLDKVEA